MHRERHLDASERILLDAAAPGITKKHYDRVADVFVDCGTVFRCYLRHLSQVITEQLGKIFRFHPIGGFGEAGNVRKADGKFLALTSDPDILPSGEYRIVKLGRQIF